jgi:hypothetical protein
MNNTTTICSESTEQLILSTYIPFGLFIASEVLSLIPPNDRNNGLIQSIILICKTIIQKIKPSS